jgi:hypothetical protein
MSNATHVFVSTKVRWLSRHVVTIGERSVCSVTGHEFPTALLPLFLQTFDGTAITWGSIKGVSDAASSLLRAGVFHDSDRIDQRKPIRIADYLATTLTRGFAYMPDGGS